MGTQSGHSEEEEEEEKKEKVDKEEKEKEKEKEEDEDEVYLCHVMNKSMTFSHKSSYSNNTQNIVTQFCVYSYKHTNQWRVVLNQNTCLYMCLYN